jgi:hypothetical protein
MSAAAELVGYAGSLAFGAFQLLLLRHQEASVRRRLFLLPQVAARLLLVMFPRSSYTVIAQDVYVTVYGILQCSARVASPAGRTLLL